MKQIGYTRTRAPAVEVKGVVWFGLFFMALIGYAVWSTAYIYSNRQHTLIGKAVDCVQRPSFEYFGFCSPQADGPACMYASQTRMQAFYDPIDFACAQFEPQRAFRFHVPSPERDTLEVAEQVG